MTRLRTLLMIRHSVHARQLDGLPGVHLEDHLVGHVDPRPVVADRRRRDQRTVELGGGRRAPACAQTSCRSGRRLGL